MNWPRLTRLDSISEHIFLPRLTPQSVVVDLGANVGGFARTVADRYGSTVYAVEASAELCDAMPAHPRVHVSNLAICGKDGPVTFSISDHPVASSLMGVLMGKELRKVQVPGLTLSTFLTTNGIQQIDLLKVDIEGAEIEMFATTPDEILRNIGQITVEFHDFCDVVSLDEVAIVHDRLRSLGFQSYVFAHEFTNSLYVNPAKCPISWPEEGVIQMVRLARNLKQRLLVPTPREFLARAK